jgi:hypothetical protein
VLLLKEAHLLDELGVVSLSLSELVNLLLELGNEEVLLFACSESLLKVNRRKLPSEVKVSVTYKF